jgi:Leucine-rich repeat (LRR) protein
MPGLEAIYLNGNHITSIEPGAFSCLTKLRRLEIAGSKLEKCVPLVELPNLETLKQTCNNIESLDELFNGLASDELNSKLRVLDLSGNKLKSLKRNELARLASLTSLRLNNNLVEEIQCGAFAGLCNLKGLYLRSCQIETTDLGFINEPDLANLMFLDLICGKKRENGILKSIVAPASSDAEKLFGHFRTRVCVAVNSWDSQPQTTRVKVAEDLLENRHLIFF